MRKWTLISITSTSSTPLTALPQEFRGILLMYWFLQMADREIGEKLSLPRRTVNNRRQRAYELLKKLMGGDEDA